MIILRGFLLTTLFSSLVAVGAAHAGNLPSPATVVGGSVTFGTANNGATQIVNQGSPTALLNRSDYSVGRGYAVQYNQPNASSLIVERVTGVAPSVIAGNIKANGQVVLVNPNGTLITPTGIINAGSFVATTSNLSDANAMAGKLIFDQPSTSSTASIVNEGTITAADAGFVALVAPSVANRGTINATLGRASLASGNKWTLDLYGDNLVKFAVDDSIGQQVTTPDGQSLNAGITTDDGSIINAARVELTVSQAKSIVDRAINAGDGPTLASVTQDGSITISQNTDTGTSNYVDFGVASGTNGSFTIDPDTGTADGSVSISSGVAMPLNTNLSAQFFVGVNNPGTYTITNFSIHTVTPDPVVAPLPKPAAVTAVSFTPLASGFNNQTVQLAVPRLAAVARASFHPATATNVAVTGNDGAVQSYCVEHCSNSPF